MQRIAILGLILTGFAQMLSAQSREIIGIENVSVIPMTSEMILHNQRVIVSDGRILRIEPISVPLNIEVNKQIDGTGKFLIPGLSEMHYHLRSNDIESDFKLLLANGITTVRNMSVFDGQDHISIREKVVSGALLGPTYYTTGTYLTSEDLETVEQVETVVREHKEKGYDFVKLADNLPKEIYLSLLYQAQLNDLPLVGHAQRDLPLEYSLRMKSIEHVEEFVYLKDAATHISFGEKDPFELNQIANELQNSGVYIGTTLTVFEFINNCLDDATFEGFKEHPLVKYLHPQQRDGFLSEKNDYRKLKDRMYGNKTARQLFAEQFSWMKSFTNVLSMNGVRLLTGSDTYGMVIVGFSLHREFELLQEAGLRPYDILLASTVTPARYLNTYALEGTISEGKIANMVMLDSNPLEDIRNSKSIEGVMLKGKWLDKEALKKMLEEVEIAFK